MSAFKIVLLLAFSEQFRKVSCLVVQASRGKMRIRLGQIYGIWSTAEMKNLSAESSKPPKVRRAWLAVHRENVSQSSMFCFSSPEESEQDIKLSSPYECLWTTQKPASGEKSIRKLLPTSKGKVISFESTKTKKNKTRNTKLLGLLALLASRYLKVWF